jgi:hypothetical protein
MAPPFRNFPLRNRGKKVSIAVPAASVIVLAKSAPAACTLACVLTAERRELSREYFCAELDPVSE